MPRIEEAALADTGQYSRNGAKYYFCWSFCWSSGQSIFINPCRTHGSDWRRGSESNEVFTDYQPQYPDLQGFLTLILQGFKRFLTLADPSGKLTPEVLKFIHGRWDGTGKYDDLYTRQDFEQWRSIFFPSDDKAAKISFDQIKQWVEFIFKAAAKPGIAGNRDR